LLEWDIKSFIREAFKIRINPNLRQGKTIFLISWWAFAHQATKEEGLSRIKRRFFRLLNWLRKVRYREKNILFDELSIIEIGGLKLKTLMPMGFLFATIFLTSPFIALAEMENWTMPNNMIMQNNTLCPIQ
jgi:hypothetical protein